MYPADAEYFGDYAFPSVRWAPASSVVAVYNSRHIAAMRKALDTAPQIDQPQISILPQEDIWNRTGTATHFAQN